METNILRTPSQIISLFNFYNIMLKTLKRDLEKESIQGNIDIKTNKIKFNNKRIEYFEELITSHNKKIQELHIKYPQYFI